MKQTFSTEIKKHENIDGAYAEIPFDVEEVSGAKHVKVKKWFDDIEHRGSIVRMGGCFIIGLTQAIRKQIGKKPEDTVAVAIGKNDEERTVELLEEFKDALMKRPDAKLLFEKLK